MKLTKEYKLDIRKRERKILWLTVLTNLRIKDYSHDIKTLQSEILACNLMLTMMDEIRKKNNPLYGRGEI